MKRLHAGLWLVVAMCFAAAFGAGFAIYLRPVEGSRNAAGTMSAISGPYTAGSVISSATINARLADIETEITASLERNGKGGMLAALRGIDGTVAAPLFSWTSETGSGYYRAGASDLGLAIAGTRVAQWTANGIRVANGAVATPSLSFLNDTGSGLYRNAANDIRVAVNGADLVQFRAGTVGIGANANPPTFTTNGTDLFINTGAATTIALRPNGAGSGTGELSVATTGTTAAAGVKIGSSGTLISKSIRGTTTWDPANLNAGDCTGTTITVTGASAGADCIVTPPSAVNTLAVMPTCWVTADTCNIQICSALANRDVASATWACRVLNP